jgi:Type II secretion system (T2SS), protein N
MAHPAWMPRSWPRLPFWLLFALLLLLFVLWRLPASLMLSSVTDSLGPSMGKNSVQIGGSLSEGQVLLATTAEAPLFLRWQWQPMGLWRGQLAWRLRGEQALRLNGEWQTSWRDWQLEIHDARLSLADFAAFWPRGWQIEGSVMAQEIELRRRYRGDWLTAGGEARWPGGTIRILLSGQAQTLNLPALRLRLITAGDSLQMVVSESATSAALADVIVTPTGQVEWRLRERLLRYSPDYRSNGGDLDAVVVTGRQTP